MNFYQSTLAFAGVIQSFPRSEFGYVYLLTPSGIAGKAALTGRFLQRKHLEYKKRRAETESLICEKNKVREDEAGSGVLAVTEVSRVDNIVAGGV